MGKHILNAVLELIKDLDDKEKSVLLEALQSPAKPRNIVKLKGALLPYIDGEAPDFDPLLAEVREERRQSLERRMNEAAGLNIDDDNT